MPLPTGTRLGPYEILAPIGAGGMGEVYKARDTRLDRTIAIKVLPTHVSDRPESRQRFEREARAISRLSHPNICALHDVGSENGVDFLVMEHLEGETLEARLARGPLPIDQTLKAGAEIASALDRAHRGGIVHRDLKPGNVMLTRSGAKLLDFGLARLAGVAAGAPPEGAGAAPTASALTALPTEARTLTAQGTILGTFQYMAPEQLEGREADARTDLFALGVLLYEMATGRRAFTGKSQASLIAAILAAEPPSISSLQPLTPKALEHVVRRCLAKDPDDRWQSAADVAGELRWIAEAGAGAAADAAAARRTGAGGITRREWIWIATAALMLAAALAAVALRPRAIAEPGPLRRLSFAAPLPDPSAPFWYMQISPDGSRMVLHGQLGAGESPLWHRRLDAALAHPLAGTEGGLQPFWSPDSRSIGFFSGGRLRKVDVSGAPPQVIAEAADPTGGAWAEDGTIIFSPGTLEGLSRVAATGGTPSILTRLQPLEEAHRWPIVIPGKRVVVFQGDASRTEDHTVKAVKLDGGEPALLLRAVTSIAYAPPHWLLYVRGGSLLAQRFDADGLTMQGEPAVIARDIVESSRSHRFEFSASLEGTLVFRSARLDSTLTWMDRTGRMLERFGKPGRFRHLDLSRDGRMLAVERLDADGRAEDIWTTDLARGLEVRATFQPGMEQFPCWSPDGRELVHSSGRDGVSRIWRRPASGEGRESLLWNSPIDCWPMSWSPDGRAIFAICDVEKSGLDIWIVTPGGTPDARPWVATRFTEDMARFSPDGRLAAFVSDRTGQSEVYVQELRDGATPVRVSPTGGLAPRWRADSGEIYYQRPDRMLMAAAVRSTAAGPEASAPSELFPISGSEWVPAPDGKRFLIVDPEHDPFVAPATVLLNWTRLLEGREDGARRGDSP